MEELNNSSPTLDKQIDSLSCAYSTEIRPFIDVIDNLRRFGLQQDVDLPNVVVVGDQSSGKSSIIEAISGIQLPRGKGIVTRCPLELQLKRAINKPWKATLTYKTLQNTSERQEIIEPSLVEKFIREAQDKMCGSSKDVSRELITLRVESPAKNAPDLTLIDLPGIARIAVEGQPRDICEQIKRIIMDHVENVNTVILCVVSANLDAAVNESIRISKQVDPEGKRTFGVITKPDTADEANKDEVLCLLNNEKIKLKKGFHMVKCRSQKELDDDLSLEQSLENEKTYFMDDKVYRTANSSTLGTMNLALKITEELVNVIKTNLPGLRDKINMSLQTSQEKLWSLPPGIPEGKADKIGYLIRIITEMNYDIRSGLLKGKYGTNLDNLFYDWRKLFNDFKLQIDSIKDTQDKMCGSSKNVSRELITLRVESPAESAPDLTLIDLPGIARIALEGQPRDICEQIRRIIMEHVQNENTVILCVVSANIDAAVNESIRISQEVDPEGKRTFGVITKPDIADESHKDEVLCLLNNKKIKLKKGFHMVKCRSQKELEENVNFEQSLENERTYFMNDKVYRNAHSSMLGTMNLALKITDELVEVIKKNLPELRDKINISLQNSQEKFMLLPPGIPIDKTDKIGYLIKIIVEMNSDIKLGLLKGHYSPNSDNLFYFWRSLFENFRKQIEMIKDKAMKKEFHVTNLREEIIRKRGNEISGFLNFELFENLIINHVILYRAKAESLLNKMETHVTNFIYYTIQNYFENLPAIESNLKQIANEALKLTNKRAMKRIKRIFEEEKLVFTLDNAFEKEMEIMKREKEQNEMQNSKTNKNYTVSSVEDNLKKNTERMLEIIECYLKVVHSRLSDIIPMCIRQCLHIELTQNLKDKFINYTTNPGVELKIRENRKLDAKRRNLKEKIDRLQHARTELAHL